METIRNEAKVVRSSDIDATGKHKTIDAKIAELQEQKKRDEIARQKAEAERIENAKQYDEMKKKILNKIVTNFKDRGKTGKKTSILCPNCTRKGSTVTSESFQTSNGQRHTVGGGYIGFMRDDGKTLFCPVCQLRIDTDFII